MKTQGAALSVRSPHFHQILQEKPNLFCLEILLDNYLDAVGPSFVYLEKLRESYPFTFHCVGMSLGTPNSFCDNFSYFKKIKKLKEIFSPLWISDHLSWGHLAGRYFHDLLPLPYNQETLSQFVVQVQAIQEFLQMPLVIENPTRYLNFVASTMTEEEFLWELTKKTDCSILLDINNVFVNASNFKTSSWDYLQKIPHHKVCQIHLAGFESYENFLIDTHGSCISKEVWSLYQNYIETYGPVPTVIEWDTNIPTLTTLLQEVQRAQQMLRSQYWPEIFQENA